MLAALASRIARPALHARTLASSPPARGVLDAFLEPTLKEGEKRTAGE